MKKIYILTMLLATLLSFVCCSPDNDMISGDDDTPVEPTPDVTPDTVATVTANYDSLCLAVMPEIQFEGDDEDMLTRSVIEFDYLASPKVMKFSWEFDKDYIGVFPIKDEGTQTGYVIKEMESSSSASSAIGQFAVSDDGVSDIFDGEYASYFPYKTYANGESVVSTGKAFTTSNVPITYLGQVQKSNVDVKTYYEIKAATDKTSDAYKTLYNTYLASETAANAHLSAYDYLVSTTTATDKGALHFTFTRMGSVVRFFFKVPDNGITYDELVLYNKDVDFSETATMNIVDQTMTGVKTSHALTLNFGEYNSSTNQYSGFDFSNTTDNASYYRDSNRGYIIAYMFMAPVNLLTVDNCYLYLLGRDKDGNRFYYKSTSGLTKLNIQNNYFYQWAPTVDDDEPITFEAVTVQQWQEETSVNNGDGGTGTEGW